ncbi:porin [Marinobacterium arenosum]|uniref:porin n=1 Tax=Marinobacterium arenosum TaxID=2862496 RepID=UPI001C9578CC|nr:porin [Marinobacterium arenosum]MBY4675876.1 porin [Marinobacterium arenosum]
MKNNNPMLPLLPAAIAMALSTPAAAGITLYDKDGTTFSTDGLINTFYVSSDIDDVDDSLDRDQARVKMGFLPNWIGFDFGKQADDLKLGARSSFWVTINDSDPVRAGSAGHGVTDTGIDVRQFYGTVEGDWGQVLVGKDFALFGRSNILGDELLLGYGQIGSDGLVDGGNVSFGNIGTGYLYPFPNAQITYRSPVRHGLQLAVGLLDPNKSAAGSEEDAPRLEAELTYNVDLNGAAVKAWLGGMSQSSSNGAAEVDSSGVSYGVNVKYAGLSLTASGFDAEGVGTAGLANFVTADNADVDGYLLQASYSFGKERLVVSYGENEGGSSAGANDLDAENSAVAWFHSVNDNLKLVAEYDRTESASRETDSVALGAVLSW